METINTAVSFSTWVFDTGLYILGGIFLIALVIGVIRARRTEYVWNESVKTENWPKIFVWAFIMFFLFIGIIRLMLIIPG